MAEVYKVNPDRAFIQSIIANGGEGLRKCYQCATCSVVCDLAPDDRPFPRKEMIWVQWGLRDRLAADPDVWLCHQCNDCSVHCPRDARPADVLAAIRQQHIVDYATPRFLAKWVNNIKLLPLMLLIPAVLLGLALLAQGPVSRALSFLDHDVVIEDPRMWQYDELFKHSLLIAFFNGFSLLAFIGMASGVLRFWNAMKAADQAEGRRLPQGGIVLALVRVIVGVFKHDQFNKCGAQKDRALSHMGVFFGFMGLLLVTLWAITVLYTPYLRDVFHYPFGFMNPVKIFANLCAVAFVVGLVRMMLKRRDKSMKSVGGSAFDWIFIWVLIGVVGTGVVVELCRVVHIEALRPIGFTIYFIHLVLVFDLLIYLPYSKFAHLVYRTVALVYAECTGRNRPVKAVMAEAPVRRAQVHASSAD